MLHISGNKQVDTRAGHTGAIWRTTAATVTAATAVNLRREHGRRSKDSCGQQKGTAKASTQYRGNSWHALNKHLEMFRKHFDQAQHLLLKRQLLRCSYSTSYKPTTKKNCLAPSLPAIHRQAAPPQEFREQCGKMHPYLELAVFAALTLALGRQAVLAAGWSQRNV
eukprot:15041-Heterococcus_DN1.PRE.1